MENGAKRFKVRGWGGCLGEVDSGLLCKAFGNIPHFVSGHLTHIILLPLTDKLAFEEAFPVGDQ